MELLSQAVLGGAVRPHAELVEAKERRPEHRPGLEATDAGVRHHRRDPLLDSTVERRIGGAEDPAGEDHVDVAARDPQAASDGALYVMRADRARKMMIETIQCAQSGDWMATFGQVDFAPIRSRRAQAIEASCAAPVGGGRTTCRLDRIE